MLLCTATVLEQVFCLSLLQRVLLKSPTTDPPTHRPLTAYPPTSYHELTLKQRSDSKYVLYSKVYENFRNHLFPQ